MGPIIHDHLTNNVDMKSTIGDMALYTKKENVQVIDVRDFLCKILAECGNEGGQTSDDI